MSLLMIGRMGQSAPAGRLKVTQISEEWLTDQELIVLLLRGSQRGLTNRQKGEEGRDMQSAALGEE